MDKQELLECRDVIKTVVFGQQTRLRAPRLKKFVKRRALLTPRRSPLSPIVENPMEIDNVKQNQISSLKNLNSNGLPSTLDKVFEEKQTSDIFNEELRRLRKISVDEMKLPSPAKRRKYMTCSIQSKLDHDIHNIVTSPIKPLPV